MLGQVSRGLQPIAADAAVDPGLEALIDRTIAGDDVAWQDLWRAIEPRLLRIVRQPRFLGPMCQREDDCRNIVVEVMARLHADRFHRLRLYLDTRRANPALQFMTWLRIVAKRVGIDYLRAHPDYLDNRRRNQPGVWIDATSLPSQSKLEGDRPPVTDLGTAHALVRFAADAVPEPQLRALHLWVHGESHDDIAHALGLPHGSDAARAVRAAIERLRRRFRPREGETP